MFVHETSCIDDGAQIGEGTKIWHFCHVMPKAKIGKNCILGQNVFVGDNVVIGDNCKIQNNVSVYDGVILEEDVFVGPSVVFTNVKYPRAFTNQKDNFWKTVVKKGATIGANATIICGNRIGQYAYIGAGAVVTHDVPDGVTVMGNPARIKEWA